MLIKLFSAFICQHSPFRNDKQRKTYMYGLDGSWGDVFPLEVPHYEFGWV